jgi:iron complex outermembrane receptor protein
MFKFQGLACLPICFFSLMSSAVADSIALDKVVVSASRSTSTNVQNASNIVVISRQEILNSGARSVAEILRGQPGVHVSDPFGDGSIASIDMRGFGASANANTVVMVDGRKLNFASDSGALYLNRVQLENIEQIEIVQGSAGVLFGNMAVGGVINIITRQPQRDESVISFEAGSYNRFSQTLRLDKQLADNWFLSGLASHRDADNYRDNNESKFGLLSLAVRKQMDDASFYAEYQHLDDYQATPGSLFLDEIALDRNQSAAVYVDDYQDLVSDDLRLGFRSELVKYLSLEVDGHWQNDDRKFVTSFRAFGPGSVATQDRETININPRLIADFPGAQVTAGLDFQSTDYLLVSAFGPQPVDQVITAAYLQSVIRINRQLDATLGIRYADIENDINANQLDDNVTIGAVGLNYLVNKNWRWYAKADQNYRFARVDEHTNPVYGQPVGLDNQTGISYEIGSNYHDQHFSIGFQLYRLDLDDEISFDSSGYANINLDKTTRHGASLFAQWFPDEHWIVGFNYDFVDSEITSGPFDGNRIPQVPENRLRLFAEYEIRDNWNTRLDTIYTGKQVYGADFANDYRKMESYTVVNMSSVYQIDGWSFTIRINNLLDEQYSESGSIGTDQGLNAAVHTDCRFAYQDFFGNDYFNCPTEFTAPERNLAMTVKLSF